MQSVTVSLTLTIHATAAPFPTATWRTRLNRMLAAGHPWATTLTTAAALTGTSGQWYADFGQWCTLMYGLTGDPAYAAKAWVLVKPIITADPPNANYIRENGWELALWYAWLSPALSSADRATYAAGLNRWCQYACAVNTAQYVGGFRASDSDQTIGQYMLLALTDLLTGTSWLAATDNSSKLPIGGLDATGVNRLTIRNTLSDYCRLATGGQWPESSEYNGGTLKLLLLGAAAVSSLAGRDCFPEVTALLPALARAARFDLTPDLVQAVQWGDDEHPRNPWWWTRLPYLGMLAGLVPGDGDLAALTTSCMARVPLSTYSPDIWRALYVYDPYAVTIPGTDAGDSMSMSGVGMLRYQTATALFHAHWQPPLGIDHEVAYLGDFQLYDSGEWALTHPIGYGGLLPTGAGTNSLILAGLASSGYGWLRTVQYAQGVGWCALTGVAGGPYYLQPYYNPPPAFLQNWTRNVVYLDPGVVVVHDTLSVQDPRTLPALDRYRTADLNSINSMPALVQWVVHAPVQPAIGPSSLTWQTPSGRPVTVQFLLPASPLSVNTINETTLLTTGTVASEQKWQARVLSNDPNAVFLVVLSVGAAPSATLNPDGSLTVGWRVVTFSGGTVTVS